MHVRFSIRWIAQDSKERVLILIMFHFKHNPHQKWGCAMCSLLKRCILLYRTHITFGVLQKKVKTFASRSNINFPRADQTIL